MSERIQTTVNHFNDGILAMSRAAAEHSIESWKAELEASGSKPLESIASDLGRLQDQLEKVTIDGSKVVSLLSKLGHATIDVAPLAEDKSDLLTKLGKQLEKAADKIATR